MIVVKPNQILRVFLKKTEPDGVISLDRYGLFDNEQGLRQWLNRFTLDMDKFRLSKDYTLEQLKIEDDMPMIYELHIKMYQEIDLLDCLENYVLSKRED